MCEAVEDGEDVVVCDDELFRDDGHSGGDGKRVGGGDGAGTVWHGVGYGSDDGVFFGGWADRDEFWRFVDDDGQWTTEYLR